MSIASTRDSMDEYNFCLRAHRSDIMMDNSVIGFIVISAIAVFGIASFCFDFIYERNKRGGPKR